MDDIPEELEDLQNLIKSFMFNIQFQTLRIRVENNKIIKEINRIKGLMK